MKVYDTNDEFFESSKYASQVEFYIFGIARCCHKMNRGYELMYCMSKKKERKVKWKGRPILTSFPKIDS